MSSRHRALSSYLISSDASRLLDHRNTASSQAGRPTWRERIKATRAFIPLRVLDGNPNEIYAAFIPLCLLLIGRAARGVRSALLFLPVVLLTMLSDGKTNSLMALFYVGLVCRGGLLRPR